jgi:hypothetical protein
MDVSLILATTTVMHKVVSTATRYAPEVREVAVSVPEW